MVFHGSLVVVDCYEFFFSCVFTWNTNCKIDNNASVIFYIFHWNVLKLFQVHIGELLIIKKRDCVLDLIRVTGIAPSRCASTKGIHSAARVVKARKRFAWIFSLVRNGLIWCSIFQRHLGTQVLLPSSP
jgi:hypothetical protein